MGKVPNGVEKIAENFNRLSKVHERYRQTDDRQTDGRMTTYSERELRKMVPDFQIKNTSRICDNMSKLMMNGLRLKTEINETQTNALTVTVFTCSGTV